MDVAGRDVTEYLQLLLQKDGYNFHTSAELDVVKDIKEKQCVGSVSACLLSRANLSPVGTAVTLL